MKRNQLPVATVFALALVASPVMAQTSTTPTTTTTDQTTTQAQTESTTPSSADQTTPNTTPNEMSSTPTTTTTTTDQSLPATGSPMPVVIAVSLAAMAVGAWLSRPQSRV